MDAVGIICELDPLHLGHAYLFQQAREKTGLPVVCAMSGNFTQRGGIACVGKLARAEMAVRCGADLVLELPTPWAMATAEVFAQGGIALLAKANVSHLFFGSECGDLSALVAVADALSRPDIHASVRQKMDSGLSYAAARQAILASLPGLDPSLLSTPNNTLGIEYIKAIHRLKAPILPATVQRIGSQHSGEASASHIRRLLQAGDWAEASCHLPPETAAILRREQRTSPHALERAMLAHLRLLDEEDFLPYDGGGEGLYHRVYQAVQAGSTLEKILARATTKRYPTARIRRILWAAFLRLEQAPADIPYLRVLAATAVGRKLLRQMQDEGKPVLTKPADVSDISIQAQALFTRESRRTDVFTLALPSPPVCGSDWRMTPIML